MLTIEEIKKELDAGREVELECVDKNDLLGTINPKHNYNQLILESSLQVSRYFIDGEGLTVFVVEPGLMITEIELEHFRIKHPAPTFDDLIDVSIKAYKDGYIKKIELINDELDVTYKNNDGVVGFFTSKTKESGYQHEQYIFDIRSLYTETFVIESEEDFRKFKSPVESIVLTNGEDIINDVMFHRNEPYFTNGGVSAVKVGFNVLKGATVTQKRGGI